MSLLCAAVVLIGFTPRFGERMLQATHAVPPSLWLHTIVATLWVVLVVVQSGLIRAGQVKLHRQLGLASVALALALVVISLWVAVVTGHARLLAGDAGRESFFAIPVSNMITFAAFFTAALVYRKQPEFHKRLMLLAAMSLAVAALARFPTWIVPRGHFNLAVDVFIGLALVRDLVVDRRIHRAYAVGFPALIAFQLFVEWLRATPAWIAFAGSILR